MQEKFDIMRSANMVTVVFAHIIIWSFMVWGLLKLLDQIS